MLPDGFEFLDPDIRLWIPAAFTAEEKSDDERHTNNWSMVARLRPGATIAQVQQQVDALNARNMERFPRFTEILTKAGFHTVATSLQEDPVHGIRGTLYLLWGGVLFVLLLGVPLYGVLTMQERMAQTLVDRRTPMLLATTFAIVALFLAAVGIYGVLAYQVTQRAREIGIRMALGSDAWGVFRLILSEGLVLLSVGLVLGALGAFSVGTAMTSQLYGVGAMDPTVMASVAAILALAAMAACAVPARRAARIDPLTALNH